LNCKWGLNQIKTGVFNLSALKFYRNEKTTINRAVAIAICGKLQPVAA
jgi:hypothetical protein